MGIVPDDCKQIKAPEAADFRRRPENHYWSGIVIHHTGIGTKPPVAGGFVQGVIEWLTGKDDNFVSAHAVIDVDGSIAILVDPRIGIAYHAGVSKWFDMCGSISDKLHVPILREKCNEYMLGIELVGDGNISAFTDEQYLALGKLCAWWVKLFAIPPNAIVGHHHVAPIRKVDPGIYFDWVHFYGRFGEALLKDSS